MGRLQGKVAVVTGGTEGIGFTTAKRFVDEGAFVFITGRRQKELDEAVKEIGSNVAGVRGDVSKLRDLDRLYATVKAKGSIDILVANAGIGEFAPLGQIKEEHFDKQFDVNVKGTLFTVQGALPLMSAGSAIVLNASLVSIKGNPAFSVYSATKAALRSFARNWAVDLKGKGIRVNADSPGVVPTPGYHTSLGMTERQQDDYIQSVISAIPLGRTGTTDEIAKAVAFLASDESSYITGSELFVDGGQGQI